MSGSLFVMGNKAKPKLVVLWSFWSKEKQKDNKQRELEPASTDLGALERGGRWCGRTTKTVVESLEWSAKGAVLFLVARCSLRLVFCAATVSAFEDSSSAETPSGLLQFISMTTAPIAAVRSSVFDTERIRIMRMCLCVPTYQAS